MKIQELRIGNYFYSVKFKKVVECTLTDLYDLCANSDGATNEPPIEKMFEPIPLTEDWFEKFEFENKKGILYYKGVFITKKNGFCYTNYKDIEQELSRTIYFVNQLQNLYFDLTGEELKLK